MDRRYRWLVAGLMILIPGLAAAGAWTRAPGEVQVISSSGRRAAPIGALAGGLAEDDSSSTSLFVEYGLKEGLTLGLTAFAEFSTVDLNDGSVSVGLHLRQRLWVGQDGDVASVQINASVPVESLISSAFGASKPDSVAEFGIRGLYGKGWAGDWGSAFVSTEAGLLFRSEGRPEELRFDATVGYAPWRCCLGLLSIFSASPLLEGDASLKIAPSFAYTYLPGWERNGHKPTRRDKTTVQLGVNYDVLNTDEGMGITVSIWREF